MNEVFINKILNINCFELLSKMEDSSIDLVLTDPPYNTTSLAYDKQKLDLQAWFDEIIRVAKPNANILIFSANRFTYKMVNTGWDYFRYEMVWDKINSKTGFLDAKNKPLLAHEYILMFSKSPLNNTRNKSLPRNTYNHGVTDDVVILRKEFNGTDSIYGNIKSKVYHKDKGIYDKRFPSTILYYKKKPEGIIQIHPSEKPYRLIEYLLKLYSNEGDLVLDTFSGSGVTALACINNNRNYIASELDVGFYNKSIERIEKVTKDNLFAI